MVDTLKWLNIRERLQVNTIYFIRKMNKMLRNVSIQEANTTAKQKPLFYKGLNLYNMLPLDVKNEVNDKVFRKRV